MENKQSAPLRWQTHDSGAIHRCIEIISAPFVLNALLEWDENTHNAETHPFRMRIQVWIGGPGRVHINEQHPGRQAGVMLAEKLISGLRDMDDDQTLTHTLLTYLRTVLLLARDNMIQIKRVSPDALFPLVSLAVSGS